MLMDILIIFCVNITVYCSLLLYNISVYYSILLYIPVNTMYMTILY